MFLHPLLMNKPAGASVPTQSIDFEASSTQRLSISDANFGAYDRALFTVNFSVLRESTGTTQFIFVHADNTNQAILLQFLSDNRLYWIVSTDGAADSGELATTATYTDTSNFYDITIQYDGNNATANDRMRIWVNQVEVTAFDIRTNPSGAVFNTAADWRISGNKGAGNQGFDGLIYQWSFYSGVNPSQATLYTAGLPNNATAITGAWSVLGVQGGSVTTDSVLAATWTNTNSATASNTIPT